MSAENIYSIKTQGRNSSYPISESSHIHSNNQSEIFNERRCISTTILASSLDHYTKTNSVNYQIVDQPMQLNSSDNSSWIQRCKQSIANIFKQISKPIIKQDSIIMINSGHQQLSTFNYDPELDLSEERLLLVSKILLTTLRESKIKHLSCDNLYLPCNHIRNIARQCLIMSAEEPFGIMGAQIKIKLTLLSSNITNTITKYLPVIRINPKQKTTFEIEIDLHEDTKVFTLRRMLPRMKMFQQIKERSPLYVSPRCLLIKNVFYKTAEPKRALVNSMA
ncbi:unnamed protein product [Rotaria socialis]|uniref:Uncharacterized protein n=4 Tax=Rotaria socialis TaxID=392032 RepID=A0A817SST8_9BILA|nr:unnamed protein product [Rotaria socialis]CAF3392162.1 unnamed protein product [Rotaria socialis]CAF3440620.1 unnamed protein product [Rotaria socialis]CAF3644866.1 unnamed protein product [Rotaria socialis]CAF3712948.1 unnamed protein product [Rotaria socialis]